MGNGYGRAALHQTLQSFLNKTLALGVEGAGCLVENEDGRVFEYRTRNAYALTLPAAKATAAVADIGVVTVFALHDESLKRIAS